MDARRKSPNIVPRSSPLSESVKWGVSDWGAVKVATWDATESLIAALKAGQVDLILAQKPAEIGSLGVDWAVKYMKDKSMPPGKKVIPGFEFFTKDNVNDADMQQWIYKK